MKPACFGFSNFRAWVVRWLQVLDGQVQSLRQQVQEAGQSSRVLGVLFPIFCLIFSGSFDFLPFNVPIFSLIFFPVLSPVFFHFSSVFSPWFFAYFLPDFIYCLASSHLLLDFSRFFPYPSISNLQAKLSVGVWMSPLEVVTFQYFSCVLRCLPRALGGHCTWKQQMELYIRRASTSSAWSSRQGQGSSLYLKQLLGRMLHGNCRSLHIKTTNPKAIPGTIGLGLAWGCSCYSATRGWTVETADGADDGEDSWAAGGWRQILQSEAFHNFCIKNQSLFCFRIWVLLCFKLEGSLLLFTLPCCPRC